MQRTEWVLFMTVLLAVAGFALPTPVVTPMFMDETYTLLPADSSQTARIWWLMGCLALYPLGQMLGGPRLGRLSDRLGRKPVLSMALVGVAVGYGFMTLAVWLEWLWLLLLARFMTGLCSGTVAIAQAMAADISADKRKAVLFARLNIALNMGWVVGPLAGGWLAEQSGDFGVPFLVAAAVSLLNLACVQLGLPSQAANVVKNEQPVERSRLFSLPRLRLFFMLTLVSYGGIMLYFNFFNVWLVERFAQNPFELAIAAVVVSIPMSLGSWTAGRLYGRVDLLWLGVGGHLLMALGMWLFTVPGDLVGLYLVMCLTGFGITIGQQANALGVSNNAPEHQQGEAMGIYRSLSMGSTLFASLLGALLIIPGLEFAYVGAGVLAMSCAVVYLQQSLSRRGGSLREA